MKTKELPKCLRPFAGQIDEVSDERSGGDGYWVYLASGWRDDEGETHCIREDTPAECAKRMPYITRCCVDGCCGNGEGL